MLGLVYDNVFIIKSGETMDNTQIKQFIEDGHLTVGIEFGSTRIKAIAIDDQCQTQQVHSNGRTVTVMVIGRIR